MVKRCLASLGIKWMVRNKTRFILCWISYAIVSVFLITVYSFSSSISSEVQELISSDAVCNQLHIQNFRIINDAVVNDMTMEWINNAKNDLEATDVRIIYETSSVVDRISGDKESSNEVIRFDPNYSLIMENDKSEGYIYTGTEIINMDNAIVTESYAMSNGWSVNDALGKEIVIISENGVKNKYTIVAVISEISKASYLNKSNIYIPIDKDDDYPISLCTLDFPEKTNIADACQYVDDSGYVYTTTLINTERMEVVSNSYEKICTFIGVILIFICMMCLVNSMMITINENSAFMELFRLMGLTIGNYRFFTCFLCMIQGAIGGIIGVLAAVIAKNGLFHILEYLELEGLSIVENFQIDSKICVLVLLADIIVSVVIGVLSFNISMKNSAESIADEELI